MTTDLDTLATTATNRMIATIVTSGTTDMTDMEGTRGFAPRHLDPHQDAATTTMAHKTAGSLSVEQPLAMMIAHRQTSSPFAHLDRASPHLIATPHHLHHEGHSAVAGEVTSLGEADVHGVKTGSPIDVHGGAPRHHPSVTFCTRLVVQGRLNSLRA